MGKDPPKKPGRPRLTREQLAKIAEFARRRGTKAAAKHFDVSESTVRRHVRALKSDPRGVRGALEEMRRDGTGPRPVSSPGDGSEEGGELVELPGSDLAAARRGRRIILRQLVELSMRATAADLRQVIEAYRVVNDAIVEAEFLNGGHSASDRARPATSSS